MQAIAAVEALHEAKLASQRRSHAAELEQTRNELERAQHDAAAQQRDSDWHERPVTAAEAEQMGAELATLQDQLQVRSQAAAHNQSTVRTEHIL